MSDPFDEAFGVVREPTGSTIPDPVKPYGKVLQKRARSSDPFDAAFGVTSEPAALPPPGPASERVRQLRTEGRGS